MVRSVVLDKRQNTIGKMHCSQ